MKRAMKQRNFGKSEMPSIAAQCMQEIYHGRDVVAFLSGKGSTDPVNEWYDIRRWIKSNDPDSYASIPMNLRLELPVRHDNPPGYQAPTEIVEIKKSDGTEGRVKLYGEKKEEEKVETENLEKFEPAEIVKKRPGRKPKPKVDGETVVRVRNQREPEKKNTLFISRVTINSVTGSAFKYEWDGPVIKITSNRDESSSMTMEFDDLKIMLEELPEAVELLGR